MSVANLCREMTKINIYSFLRKREACDDFIYELNVREYRRGNKKWKIQRYWQHRYTRRRKQLQRYWQHRYTRRRKQLQRYWQHRYTRRRKQTPEILAT